MGSEAGAAIPESLASILETFIEATDDLMTVVDRDARFVYANPSARRVFGLEPEACHGRSAWDFCHPADRGRTRAAFEAWITEHGRKSYTFWNRQVSLDGTVRHMHWRIHPHCDDDGKPRFLASIARDITALKEAEREHVRAETRLHALFSGMLDAVITIDSVGTIQDASNSVLGVLGYGVDELVGENIKILMPEPHRSQHDDYLARYRETGQTWILNSTRSFEVLRKDGTPIDIELSVSRIDIPGEVQPLFCGSFRDVTDRKAAERALAESEQRFRAIFHHEFQHVALLRPDGVLLEVNDTAVEATGFARDEVVGAPLWEAPWWRRDEAGAGGLRGAVARASQGELVRFDAEIRTAGGELLTVDFSLKPVHGESGDVTRLIAEARDITELKRAQERETAMLRSLATLGESASILAHEIKNPITAVNLALRAVADQLGEDHRTVLEDLVGRMRLLEERLRRSLSFTRPVGARPRAAAVRELCAATCDLLAPEAEARGIEVSIEVDDRVRELWADPGLTEEVLTNLVRNALDALVEGGRVRITARNGAAPAPGSPGTVELLVEDDGPGVPESAAANLFRPFFTTKEDGTGLGLAVAKKIIEEQRGTLELLTTGDAAPRQLGGACFRIELPAADPAAR